MPRHLSAGAPLPDLGILAIQFARAMVGEIIPKVASEPDEEKRWALSNDVMRFSYENVLEFGTYSTNVIFPVGPRVEQWYEHLQGLYSWPTRFEYASHRK